VETTTLIHSSDEPYAALAAKGPHIVEATVTGSLHDVKPYTLEVRAAIDNL
jgi:hypothetical protein